MLARLFTPPKFLPNLSKFFQKKFNAWLIRYLPFSVSRSYIIALGWLFYWFKPREKALITRAIVQVTQCRANAKELRRTIRQTFKGIFEHYHEKLFVAYTRLPRTVRFLLRKVQTSGEAYLQEAFQAGRGVLLVTGHFGAVEFLPGVLALKGYPVTMICRFQTSGLREVLLEKAKAINLHLIDTDAGNTLFGALRALRNGHIVITEAEEFDEWRPCKDKKISFLGARLGYDRTLDLLAQRSQAPVVNVLCSRHGKQRYTLEFTPVTTATPGNGYLGLQNLKIIEQAIIAAPTQWYQWKKFGQLLEPRWTETAVTACPARGYPADGYLTPVVAG